jgi:hypothetical protein
MVECDPWKLVSDRTPVLRDPALVSFTQLGSHLVDFARACKGADLTLSEQECRVFILQIDVDRLLVSVFDYDNEVAFFMREDRLAPGRYLPGASTDPYVPALRHTASQIMASLGA